MKQYSLLLLFSILTVGVFAQDQKKEDARKQRWEEMKAKRAAYYTDKIGLTAKEAELFWPIYNELQDKKGKLHRQMSAPFRKVKKDNQGNRIMDYAKICDNMMSLRVQEANLDKNYHEKFKKVLSPEKLFRYYEAEREWAGKLLKDIEKRGMSK
jgi:hypothetical protein